MQATPARRDRRKLSSLSTKIFVFDYIENPPQPILVPSRLHDGRSTGGRGVIAIVPRAPVPDDWGRVYHLSRV